MIIDLSEEKNRRPKDPREGFALDVSMAFHLVDSKTADLKASANLTLGVHLKDDYVLTRSLFVLKNYNCNSQLSLCV